MSFNHKHLLSMNDLSESDIMTILENAVMFEEVNRRRIKKVPALRGRTVVNMFFEPSTRTRTSFELAEKRLSCDTINAGGSSSSTVKGESLGDTIMTLDAYNVDCFVVRHKYAGAAKLVTQYTDACVIDAGDGKHQHPTQALLDLYSIWRRKGTLEGLKVGIVGDIAHSRVCGSLIRGLHTVGAHVTLIAPATLLPARPDVMGADATTPFFDDVLPELDVVYMLRVQQERLENSPFPSLREYSLLYGLNKSREHLMKKDAIICHPGPINRGVELDSYMADHPERSVILDQVFGGLCVRMSVLYLLLGGAENGISA
ncbi:MAG: aspartate carbamoyltransferase catalytic subunit [Eggerthellales bacterium]|nr:aspartate carbamoyltransferase catalytic subunit [Eggerthellales bacterium]